MKKSELRKIIREEIQKLNEAGSTPADEFALELEKVMKKHFPNSYCSARYSTNLMESIFIRFLIGSKAEWSNGIPDNAPCIISGHIVGFKNGELTDKMEFEPAQFSMFIKPVKNPMYAFERIKFPARKTRGDSKKILKAIDTLFARSHDIIKKNVDGMVDNHKK